MKYPIILSILAFVLFSCVETLRPDEDCDIYDLVVDTGDCSSDSTYTITIDFEFENTDGQEHFDLFIRDNELIGYYALADLPLTIADFPISGHNHDYIKVCINDNPDCCEEIEFMPSECDSQDSCAIRNLVVDLGLCTSDSTYNVTINFDHENAGNAYFDVFVQGDDLIGYYELADLPVTIHDFPLSGHDYDYIKVCINDHPHCCEEIEFLPPDCEIEECAIENLVADVGECNSDSTYSLTIDFDYANPGNAFFEVFIRDNEYLGYYALADLPITIHHFEPSGHDYDYIKVCINDVPDCCAETEFLPPACLDAACEIGEIMVDIGACTSDSTYNLTINFDYAHETHDHFDVFARNNVHVGYYALADLPVTLHNFDLSGNDYDFIKVCINDNVECCSVKEFPAPICP